MKIALLIGRFPPDLIGGAELQAKQLATELARRGHQVIIFTRRYSERPYFEHQDGYMIRRRNELPAAGLRMVWDIFPTVWQVAQLQPNPDVLLCYQTLNSGMIGAIAQKLLGIPMVLSIRGNREYRLKNSRFQHFVVPPIFYSARRVIVQSTYILEDMLEQLRLSGDDELAKCMQRKTLVIPNGISIDKFNRSKGDKVIYVGRLIKNKGVADLIDAMKCLPEYELLIVGDGPDKERLELMARGMQVTFTGQVEPSEVDKYLQEARVLVLPTCLGDGLPNVILEAMACGIPVIATRTAGIPDLIRHSKTGFLIEKGDVQQMTNYIDCLMKDEQLWNKFSGQTLMDVQPFAWDNIAPQIELLISDVIDSR